MFKFLFIAGLIAILVFFILRRFGFVRQTSVDKSISSAGDWRALALDSHTLKNIVKKTLFTVGIGFILLIITLVIASKFKIVLILIPISLYLIGQYFILLNQINIAKKQQLFYNPDSDMLRISYQDNTVLSLDMKKDVIKIQEVKGVQKNNGLLFGYYRLYTANGTIHLPYILIENTQNRFFFDRLALFPREIETKLFPVI